MEPRIPDGSRPFDDQECGHLPCPPWLADDQTPVAVQGPTGTEEPELDSPHHVHDLWVVLGLGEE
jgi:hypothetical protein